MLWVGILALLAATGIGVVLTRAMISLAPRFGLIDHPRGRKDHARSTPLGGGIAVFGTVAFLSGSIVLAAWLVARLPMLSAVLPKDVAIHAPGVVSASGLLGVVLLASFVQWFVGLLDDRFSLSALVRLLVELALVLWLVSWGVEISFPPGWHVVTIPLTVLWIVGLTNAVNFLDNMDGLAAGVSGIASLFLALVSFWVGDYFVGGGYLLLAGALSGFLWYNLPPARIFLGDAGSNFVGFWLGVLTVINTFKTESSTHLALMSPVCILAVPIYDSISVTAIRLWQGRSPFAPDHQHFNHRLVKLGFSRRSAVLLVYLLTIISGLSGLILYFVPPIGGALVIVQVLCLFGLVATMEWVASRKVASRAETGCVESAETRV